MWNFLVRVQGLGGLPFPFLLSLWLGSGDLCCFWRGPASNIHAQRTRAPHSLPLFSSTLWEEPQVGELAPLRNGQDSCTAQGYFGIPSQWKVCLTFFLISPSPASQSFDITHALAPQSPTPSCLWSHDSGPRSSYCVTDVASVMSLVFLSHAFSSVDALLPPGGLTRIWSSVFEEAHQICYGLKGICYKSRVGVSGQRKSQSKLGIFSHIAILSSSESKELLRE